MKNTNYAVTHYFCSIAYEHHLKSLKTQFDQEVNWGPTATIRSRKSHLVCFDAVHIDFTWVLRQTFKIRFNDPSLGKFTCHSSSRVISRERTVTQWQIKMNQHKRKAKVE